MIHDTRIVPTDGRAHVGGTIRGYHGDSRGHWEGDTLVVDVTNFSAKSDYRGARETLHLVERFTRTADRLRYEVSVDDPHTWSQAVDRGARPDAAERGDVRVRLPRGQQLDAQHPERRPGGGTREVGRAGRVRRWTGRKTKTLSAGLKAARQASPALSASVPPPTSPTSPTSPTCPSRFRRRAGRCRRGPGTRRSRSSRTPSRRQPPARGRQSRHPRPERH